MKAYYVLRWGEGVAKLHGKTKRKTPSILSWNLVLSNGDWYLFPDNPFEQQTFAVKATFGNSKQRTNLAKRCFKQGKPVTIEIPPGHLSNDSKDIYIFMKGIWTSDAKQEGDKEEFSITTEKGTFHFKKRKGLDQWRVKVNKKEKFSKTDAATVLENALDGEAKFKPNTDPLIEFEKKGDYWEIKNVPIAKPGLWNGKNVSVDLLKRLVRNWQLLKDTLYVPLKLGHKEKLSLVENAKYEKTGDPALGYVKELWYDEKSNMLRATFTRVPSLLVDAIKKGAYTGVSMEIDRDFSGNRDVLVAVALLGADIPAITDLPRLIQIYSREGRDIEEYQFTFGGDSMNSIEKLKLLEPSLVLCFSKTDEDTGGELPKGVDSPEDFFKSIEDENKKKLVGFLHDERGYPYVLAEELVNLLPNPDMEQVKLLPEYDKDMWEARLDKLEDRAKKPEKAASVITELKDFLALHGDELEDKEKERVKAIIKTAEENLPHIEVEDMEGKYPKAEYPKADVEIKEPSKGEKYPEEGSDVKVEDKYPEEKPEKEELSKEEFPDEVLQELKAKTQELAASMQVDQQLEALKASLKAKAKEALEAKLSYFAANGLDATLIPELRTILEQLDPVLTEEPDRNRILQSVMKILSNARPQPVVETFSRLTPPTVEAEPDLSKVILEASPKFRIKK